VLLAFVLLGLVPSAEVKRLAAKSVKDLFYVMGHETL